MNSKPLVVTSEPIALTIENASKAVGIGRSKLFEAIKLGTLKSRKVCGRRLILKADLEDFLTSASA